MSKAKTNNKASKKQNTAKKKAKSQSKVIQRKPNRLLIISTSLLSLITIVLLCIIIVLLSNNNPYVGAYESDRTFAIILRPDNTCNIYNYGYESYIEDSLRCNYEIKGQTIYFDRQVRRYHLKKDGYEESGRGIGYDNSCRQFEARRLSEYCEEEIDDLKETATIENDTIIYQKAIYTKL